MDGKCPLRALLCKNFKECYVCMTCGAAKGKPSTCCGKRMKKW